jgi:superfamily II DNA/RNA helicase
MSFTQMNLDPQISKAISVCGYTKPTPIQSRCIPDILQGKDLVASAQTGTGKTAAFVLPALQRISESKTATKPRILILTPTRELATQIKDAAGKYGKFLRFNMANLVGGMSYRQQIRDLSRNVDIIVATPGRLIDHVENHRVDLSGIEMLILDEADRMLDMGFIDDVQLIASQTPKNRQTLLFSATVDDQLARVVKHLLNDPIRIDLSHEKVSALNIQQLLYMADNIQHKNRLLQHFLKNGNIFKGIIFSGTKVNADRLAGELCDAGFKAAALHGDLKQSVRNRTIEQLRRNKVQFLVATDVAARGIDISDITHVINFDLPRFCEDYVHRIGRTGRAGKSGIAISFATSSDARHLQKIERYTNQKIQRDVVVGLEPSKKSHSYSDSGEGKKKKFGKSRDGKSFSKGGFGKKEFGRSDSGKRSFGKSDSARGESGRRSFAKSDSARGETGRRSFDKGDSASGESGRRSFGKSDSAGEGRRSFAKSESTRGEGRSFARSDSSRGETGKRFGKSDFARKESGGRSFGKSDSTGEGRRSFAKSESTRGEGRSFARSDSSRSESSKRFGKSDFARKESGGRSFARSDSARGESRKGGFGKSDSARGESGKRSFGKSDSGKRSFSKSDSGSRDFSRSDSGRKSFSRDGAAKKGSFGKSGPKSFSGSKSKRTSRD